MQPPPAAGFFNSPFLIPTLVEIHTWGACRRGLWPTRRDPVGVLLAPLVRDPHTGQTPPAPPTHAAATRRRAGAQSRGAPGQPAPPLNYWKGFLPPEARPSFLEPVPLSLGVTQKQGSHLSPVWSSKAGRHRALLASWPPSSAVPHVSKEREGATACLSGAGKRAREKLPSLRAALGLPGRGKHGGGGGAGIATAPPANPLTPRAP